MNHDCRAAQTDRRDQYAQSTVAAYRVSVGSVTESRSARKLLDELKKRFCEPVTISFDEKQKQYSVLIGQFANRSDAAQFLERLRKTGYESLRIIREQGTTDTPGESLTDTNARIAKHKAQPSDNPPARQSSKSDRPIQLIALDAGKIAASSESELVISPGVNLPHLERNRQHAGSAENDKGSSKRVSFQDPNDSDDAEYGKSAAPVAVRIGKTYREIHLVLNPGDASML
jgi:hypothetical protein